MDLSKVPWWVPFPVSLGFAGVSTFSSSVLSETQQAIGFVISALVLALGLVIALWHFGLGRWLGRHVWWRFGRSVPAKVVATLTATKIPAAANEIDKALAVSRDAAGNYDYPKVRAAIERITDPEREFKEAFAKHSAESDESEQPLVRPAPRPTFVTPLEGDDLGYAYPKAVLKAEIPKPRGTISATEGRHVAVSVLMRLKNDHNKPLTECSVWVADLSENGVAMRVGKSLRVGGGNTFTVQSHTATNFHVVTRDMSDEITPAPFILKLVKRDLLLKENSQYLVRLELRSRYRYPTLVHVQIDTGTGLDVEVKIIRQSLEPEIDRSSEASLAR